MSNLKDKQNRMVCFKIFIVSCIFILYGCNFESKTNVEEKMLILLNNCIYDATKSYNGKSTVYREPTHEELKLCTEYSKSVLTLQPQPPENVDDNKTTKN